jgi:hypothetical protein
MLKQILIPVAALAITATSASAFMNTDMLSQLSSDLSDTERTALERVAAIHEEAKTEVEQVLTDAGITKERMDEIRQAVHEERKERHEEMKQAIAANDYEAFQVAAAQSPFAENITTPESFAKLVEAHELRENGDTAAADAILQELGFTKPDMGGKGKGGGRHMSHN